MKALAIILLLASGCFLESDDTTTFNRIYIGDCFLLDNATWKKIDNNRAESLTFPISYIFSIELHETVEPITC